MRRDYYQRESHESSMQILVGCFYAAVGALIAGGLAEVFFDGWIVGLVAVTGAIVGLFASGLMSSAGMCSRAEEARRRGNEFLNNCGRIPPPLPEEDINDQV